MLTLNPIPGPFGRAAIQCDNNWHLYNKNSNNNSNYNNGDVDVDVVDNELKTLILTLIINECNSMADCKAVDDYEEELFNFKSLLNDNFIHKMSINNKNTNNDDDYYYYYGKLNNDFNNNGIVQYRIHSMIHKHFSFVSYPQR